MPTGIYERPFWNRVNKNGPTPEHRPDLGPCWNWLGTKNQYGYARVMRKSKFFLVHRVLYERTIGPVPDGLELDHLCRNRGCINPAHMEAVTHKENCLRGGGTMNITHRTRTCQRGHTEFYEPKTGHIRCKTCKLESNKRWKDKSRLAAQLNSESSATAGAN